MSFSRSASLLLVLTAMACGDETADVRPVPGSSLPTDPVGPQETRSIVRRDNPVHLGSPILEIGGDDATDSTAFARINGAVLDDDQRLWFTDLVLAELIRVDTTGAVEIVGRRGRGPREFIQPKVLGWSGGRLAIDDGELGRVTLVDPETDSVKTLRIDPSGWKGSPRFMVGLGSEGEYVFIPFYSGSRWGQEPDGPRWVSESPVLLAVEQPPDTGFVLFEEKTGDLYWDGERYRRDPFSNAWVAGVIGDTIALVGALGGDILLGDVRGSVRVALNMEDRPGREVSEAVAARVERYLEALPDESARWYASPATLRERGYPSRMPFFDRLVVSRDGLLWVHRKLGALGAEEARWEVVALDGTQIGTVFVRAGEQVLAAGRRRVATLSSDALGSPVLRVYEHGLGR